VTIIGHRKTAELLAFRKDARRPVPSVTFDETTTLEQGGQRVELAYKGVNHSKEGKSTWDLHQDYEQLLISRMHDELLPKWRNVLAGTETYLRDNCWAMLETFVVQGKPEFLKG
jgi:hypothetical protein